MNDTMNDQKLNEYCKIVAREILDGLTPDQRKGEDVRGGDLLQELAHEQAEGSQHVIYAWRAHDVCQNCTLDWELINPFLDVLQEPLETLYDRTAMRIAYHEILNRIMDAIYAAEPNTVAEISKEDG